MVARFACTLKHHRWRQGKKPKEICRLLSCTTQQEYQGRGREGEGQNFHVLPATGGERERTIILRGKKCKAIRKEMFSTQTCHKLCACALGSRG